MSRKVKWHCSGGHDFETDTELRQERCPICGSADIERAKEISTWQRLMGERAEGPKRWYWR